MKKLISAVLFAGLLGCSSNNHDPKTGTVNDLSPFARKFLSLQAKSSGPMAASANNTMNQGYAGAMNSFAQMGGGGTVVAGDSSITGTPPGWTTCAVVTQTDNPDGSTTITTDYGDGCWEGSGDYKYFMFGKNSSTWKYVSSKSGTVYSYEYLSRYKSVNFGGAYTYDMNNDGIMDTTHWLSNGSSTYEGQSSYDTVTMVFTGYFIFSDTSQYSYDGVVYSYKSAGQTTYEKTRSVASQNDYAYENATESYSSTVLAPLVTDFTCREQMYALAAAASAGNSMMPVWITYVSGRERIEYKNADSQGEFEIDYGDGTCDNIITIIENGKTIRIDLGRDWAVLYANSGP